MEEKEIRYEAPEKPDIEELIHIKPDFQDFDEQERAEALIKNLDLKIGDTIKESTDYRGYGSKEYTINSRMVLSGNPPKYYQNTIDNIKKILTDEEKRLITNYIRRKKENDKVRDKIYYGITKRTDKFYKNCEIKKNLKKELIEILELFKDNSSLGINNTIYWLLSKDDKLNKFSIAWNNKPIPNTQEWREENDGEYSVLTDSEADRSADDYLTDDPELWRMAVEGGHTESSLQDWAEDIINCDGRGSLLASYDGLEDYEEINGIDYYIYRTN